ncbi:dihydrofolate reductase family protein [Rhodococcus sp. BP-252]|uniref:dihydrofolate reductase family protein n=1 Tax=unclassified Rhodococcus (in: high G+C Gram-positive bacteria) TaxID=192944 RepID=UPI001430BC18|nr:MULTISPECIES: dihydrofolate reductase family protein [unclassified Rhodococcus (in: high G+C Gram-positive bacteria)]MBY6414098.1 dihydrofolate reductase family protein [Rhodococcus sp. BP-320]MBY6418869.1 dihydrofolate reductase family protein [Rhodococcus sp. BP-321]MBY6423386.1 dihydrofolate reductase family protein [Rhodococcus sp. BP-324]MBY6428840.1 dihydrofolate reductase family protein [Rhodococcus sp. BP-323]MBY6433846.1 dihydrofolate reductase family protein [Rhodococcus sp. BP-32
MATLLYSATMSLDGYIAGPDGDMSWLSEYMGEPNETADRLLARVGSVLCGNATFGGDDPNRGTENEGAFGGQYDGPVVLLTHRPPVEPPAGVTVATDLLSAIDAATDAAGEKYVNVLGADVARQCIEERLLDEILVFTVPVLLGDGVRLFSSQGGHRVRLERLSGEVEHWYRIRY